MTNGREETLCDVCLYAWDRRFCVKCLEKIPRILMQREIASLKAENERMREALVDSQKLDHAKQIIVSNHFVFDDLENRWQKLAFTFYTDIVAIDEKAKEALSAGEEKKS